MKVYGVSGNDCAPLAHLMPERSRAQSRHGSHEYSLPMYGRQFKIEMLSGLAQRVSEMESLTAGHNYEI